ncbi:MAG: dihydrodipicolinate synthase family protein [Gemmatimonadaceae bacterium]
MNLRQHLLDGQVIPAHPLALTARRMLDERRQRALTRYYVDSGAGGIAVGVHTTQFAIRDFDLYRPVLALAAETARASLAAGSGDGGPARPFALVAGAVGETAEAVHDAGVAASLGYHAVLLSLGGLGNRTDAQLVRHCRAVAEVLPLIGFYLQPAVGGRQLGERFWRDLAELPGLVAVKIAPFDRYRTMDVVRAVTAAGRDDVALYTGNDDSIVVDLLTPFPVDVGGRMVERRIVGGLLGQWAVWTRRAVEWMALLRALREEAAVSTDWLRRAAALTDANGAIFDAANGFAGCIPGIHEVLRRQGLLRGTWTLDPRERLSPGQAAAIDRVCRRHPELTDDAFVAEHLDRWLG